MTRKSGGSFILFCSLCRFSAVTDARQFRFQAFRICNISDPDFFEPGFPEIWYTERKARKPVGILNEKPVNRWVY